MTKKEITAVKRTLKQWEWLVINPNKGKSDYFYAFPRLRRPNRFLCYLCELWWKQSPSDIILQCNKKCPLATRTLMCDSVPENPFQGWSILPSGPSYETLRTYHANRIVKACRRWLRKYDK